MLKTTIYFSDDLASPASLQFLGPLELPGPLERQSRLEGQSDQDGESDQDGQQQGTATLSSRPKLARPPLYKVVLLNDDYTPMEFVVDVLVQFFQMSEEKATQIMLTIHTKGQAVCGVYSRDVAETKALQVNEHSREHGQPLLCQVEIDQ